jgi:uncharacterized protein involved in exopolysaccharide biosynthesis
MASLPQALGRRVPNFASDAATPKDIGDLPPTPVDVLSRAVLFLRRNLLRIALVALTAATLLFLLWSLFFIQYSATALIEIGPLTNELPVNSGAPALNSPDSNAIDSLELVAKSDAFLGALIDRLDLAHSDAFAGASGDEATARAALIDKLRARLNVARRGTTYVVDFTAKSPSATTSAAIANAAAQKIIDDQDDLHSETSAKTAQDIENHLAELRESVTRAEGAAADLKASLNVTEAGQNSTLLEQRVFELNQQSVLAAARTAETRARFEQMRKAATDARGDLAPSLQSPVLNNLRSEYAQLSRQYADLGAVLGDRHPQVVGLSAQLADARRQIDAELARTLATARTELLEAEQREAALSRQLKDAQKESGDLGPKMVKLDELDREAKAERSIYERLLNQQRELAQTKNFGLRNIHFVSPAAPPTKAQPGTMARAGIAAGLGLLCGLALAFIRESMSTALTSPRQAEQQTGVEVVGLAPRLASAKSAERLRPDLIPWLADLCALMAPSDGADKACVALISSAFRGAGRSTVATSCARYLRANGARVLLIDADRPPADDKDLQLGLLDVLKHGYDLRIALRRDTSESYSLLAFGGSDVEKGVSVSALMSGAPLRALIRLCRQRFDVVIIDGPPALQAEHARLLARCSDLAVIVAEWGKANPSEVTETVDRLGLNEAVLFFNKVDVAQLRLIDPLQARRIAAAASEFGIAT